MTNQLGPGELPMLGPTAGPAVPVVGVPSVGPLPSLTSAGTTTPFLAEGGGTGSEPGALSAG